MRFIPGTICGVRVLRGVEANILGRDGRIDLPEDYLGRLDFVMAGLHDGCGFDGQGQVANTEAVVSAMHHPRIKAISHPGNPLFPVDYAAIVAAAVATGTALEVNNSSLSISRAGSRPNCKELARLIARSGAPVAVGSDAHIAQGVGVFDEALALLTVAGVTEEQVVNSSLEKLLGFLGIAD
jgi:putative hydrolase